MFMGVGIVVRFDIYVGGVWDQRNVMVLGAMGR